MTPPFSVWTDAEGNLHMTRGPVIARHATTAVFWVGSGGIAVAAAEFGEWQTAAGSGASYEGGNGTNVAITAAPLGTMAPYGKLRVSGPDEWTAAGNPNLTLSFDAGDGSAELSDGTDVVASLPAGATIAPYGTAPATAYGKATYNGGVDFDVLLDYEGAADPFPPRAAYVGTGGSTIREGTYIRTGWQTWENAGAPTWTITLAGDGSGEMDDGTDVVATRAAIAGMAYDPTGGQWESTVYGAANYGGDFIASVGLSRAVPVDGVLYVHLTLDGNAEVTSVTGPFFGASLPVNTSGDHYSPVAVISGGLVEQVQFGPIYWVPPEPGPAGTGLTWVSLTAAAYAALGTPDADTIYDITDYP